MNLERKDVIYTDSYILFLNFMFQLDCIPIYTDFFSSNMYSKPSVCIVFALINLLNQISWTSELGFRGPQYLLARDALQLNHQAFEKWQTTSMKLLIRVVGL